MTASEIAAIAWEKYLDAVQDAEKPAEANAAWKRYKAELDSNGILATLAGYVFSSNKRTENNDTQTENIVARCRDMAQRPRTAR